jgi:hypothetical protein
VSFVYCLHATRENSMRRAVREEISKRERERERDRERERERERQREATGLQVSSLRRREGREANSIEHGLEINTRQYMARG